jgi:hypothetical protein
MPQGRDAIKLNAKRSYTPEGYLVAPAVLARSGVLPYYAMELGLTDRAPNQIVQVYRSADTLAKSAPTFEHKPITMDHPPEGVDASTWRELAVGDVHDVLAENDRMHATVIVRDKAAIEEINKGRRQLSNGYTFELCRVGDGSKPYEFEQVDIQGNHIAIVDRARCGPSCVVGDRDPISEREEKRVMVKVAMDGYPGEVDEVTAGIIIQRLQKQVADAAAEKKTIKVKGKEMDGDDVEEELEKRDKKIKDLQDAQMTPEQFRQQYAAEQRIIAQVRDMLPQFEVAENADIKIVCADALRQLEANETTKAQITALLDGAAIDKASTTDLMRAVRTIHASTAADRQARDQRNRNEQLGRGLFKGRDSSGPLNTDGQRLDGRDLWVRRQTHMMNHKPDGSEQELEL